MSIQGSLQDQAAFLLDLGFYSQVNLTLHSALHRSTPVICDYLKHRDNVICPAALSNGGRSMSPIRVTIIELPTDSITVIRISGFILPVISAKCIQTSKMTTCF